MTKILVVYESDYGSTEKMARAAQPGTTPSEPVVGLKGWFLVWAKVQSIHQKVRDQLQSCSGCR